MIKSITAESAKSRFDQEALRTQRYFLQGSSLRTLLRISALSAVKTKH